MTAMLLGFRREMTDVSSCLMFRFDLVKMFAKSKQTKARLIVVVE